LVGQLLGYMWLKRNRNKLQDFTADIRVRVVKVYGEI